MGAKVKIKLKCKTKLKVKVLFSYKKLTKGLFKLNKSKVVVCG